ncbi:CD276 antigen homolog isoform X2 [Amia ocellicauda]|uniref:CD276 antigen homolog isoform X2 n=1 Tax=Amia ocellicauda TaxID=2972642 RepID=UPI00346404B6
MNKKSMVTLMWYVSLLLIKSSFSAEFEVRVPSTPQVAVYGRYVVLDCSFTVDGSLNLMKIVVTWQRGNEVVHSFYYGNDQLDRQSPRYTNRTSLYLSQLEKGNASLKLEGVRPEDAGDYTCSISTLLGSQKRTFPLMFAAFYSEPHLEIKVSPQDVEFSLASQGYPDCTVQWRNGKGEDISMHALTRNQQNADGLYSVSSSLAIKRRTNSTITFVLKNEALNQEITRELSLIPDEDLPIEDLRCRWMLFIPVLFFIVVILGLFSVVYRKMSKCFFKQADTAVQRCETCFLKT